MNAKGMPGAGLTGAFARKAQPDRPALQPYWGKPAVRNERGGGGDVGIIRSPVRATILPDRPCRLRPQGRYRRARKRSLCGMGGEESEHLSTT
jgi:hypothetical protein